MNTSPETIEVLGTFTVIKTFQERRGYEYAAAFDDYRIDPQVSEIQLVKGRGRPFIRVILKGQIVNSWQQQYIGNHDEYWITDTSTWSFARYVRDGYYGKNNTVATLELAEGYKIIQHSNENGKLSFYSHTQEPMIRIVKNDGSPISNSISYWCHEINGMWHEPML